METIFPFNDNKYKVITGNQYKLPCRHMQYLAFKLYLPGQQLLLHETVFVGSPSHKSPPFDGASHAQVLVHIFAPPPQLTEQEALLSQEHQLPSTESIIYIRIKIIFDTIYVCYPQ